MTDQPFEKLAEQAASGLKGDQELYLDVKQELRSHLEEKAEKFTHEGHSEDESADLARKSFGSPLDVAADLLNANKRRMKLRALFRLAFGALIVPVAILLALYLGYGRLARMHVLATGFTGPVGVRLPPAPFYGMEYFDDPAHLGAIPELVGGESHAQDILRYWEAHKQDPDGRIYYAYYALFLKTDDERTYVDAMRQGERLEPENAFYNVMLAEWYLRRGMISRGEGPAKYGEVAKDEVLDQRLFGLGIVELRKAMSKPYLHTHQAEVVRRKLDAMPSPLLTEQYMARVALAAGELLPHLARYRALARKMPGCARILISQGKTVEAEAVMDTWRPYSDLLLSDSDTGMIHGLVTAACGTILAKEAAGVYDQLGAKTKAEDARRTLGRLRAFRKAQTKARRQVTGETQIDSFGFEMPRTREPLTQHGSFLAKFFMPVLVETKITPQELTPSRMHEHVMAEEILMQVLMIVFALLLLLAIASGFLWMLRLRRAASAPLLLVLPAHEVLWVLLMGIMLPMAVYWVYSRMPIIGGREFGLTSTMWPRFVLEYLILGIAMVAIPITMVRRRTRQRCLDLDVPIPDSRQEIASYWRVWASLPIAAVIAAIAIHGEDPYGKSDLLSADGQAMFFVFVAVLLVTLIAAAIRQGIGRLLLIFVLPAGLLIYSMLDYGLMSLHQQDSVLRLGGLALAAALAVSGAIYAIRHRGEHGLYFGTLARSIAPVCALAIIFMSLTIQPWLMFNEAQWLRRDTVGIGYLANPGRSQMAFSLPEAREIHAYNESLRKALEEK